VGFHNQLSDLRPAFNQIVFPVHSCSIATAVSTSDAGLSPRPLEQLCVMQTSKSHIECAVAPLEEPRSTARE
jgi:hypothetical protein